MNRLVAFVCLVMSIVVGLARGADEPTGIEFFEKKIRPALVQHCYECHSADAKVLKGGLLLDIRDGWRKGGDSGPSVVPGKPSESLLIQALKYEELEMPPKGKLPDAIIDDFVKWVEMGAPDPRTSAAKTIARREIDIEAGKQFWCFQSLAAPAIPQVKDHTWAYIPLDRFVLAKLEDAGLRPVGDADRATLLRRVTFDLIGLPPPPGEIDDFVNDPSPNAFEEVVDRLLASPQFGERWGRHWLDVARFAESSGGGRSMMFPEAWRYRDYVIRSFQDDKPFDQFVREQVAGDLLPAVTPQQRAEQIVATALLVLGPTNYEEQDKLALEFDVIDEQIDTLGRAFLGMTIGCARCHDHKFDPIPTRDYYALAGIFRSTHLLIHENVSRWLEQPLPMSAEQAAAVKQHELALADLKRQLDTAKAEDTKGLTPLARQEVRDVKELETRLKELQDKAPYRPKAMSVGEAKQTENTHIRIRGNVHSKGEQVPRGFLQVATYGAPPTVSENESGRRELAEWLTSPSNPLTARVMANRVWQHLFGEGLVRSVDNFGTTGDAPSHPELLDHLAARFQNGWSIKSLVREIVLSRTYRLASASQVSNFKSQISDLKSQISVDPENRLLWRQNRRRLDAEALRDAMLIVSGELDREMFGRTIKGLKQTGSDANVGEMTYVFDDTRRSVYTPIFRNRLLEIFEVFDFANPNISLGRRNVTTVPTQALFLMNSPFVMDEAREAARTLLAQPNLTTEQRVVTAYRTTVGREPTHRERDIALRIVTPSGENSVPNPVAWERLFQALFASVDFRYVE